MYALFTAVLGHKYKLEINLLDLQASVGLPNLGSFLFTLSAGHLHQHTLFIGEGDIVNRPRKEVLHRT